MSLNFEIQVMDIKFQSQRIYVKRTRDLVNYFVKLLEKLHIAGLVEYVKQIAVMVALNL